ncbi:hypothetical protein [Leucobacter sp. G161]|uniref:hypothetical protein n=1 Tax=Leucobacter sp. G161 TaxID=663704 RepID=UPI00073CDB18|nr:hypothetical protein [Leucobacter sp. G161]KUF07172.1 hypothetical protein AUL38_02470 [Leucobacter sp. G161]
MTDESSRNKQLANQMQVWAAIALIIGVVGGAFLPNLALFFRPNIQEAWQVIQPIGSLLSQFALPLAAALLVGAIVLRQMPDRSQES